VDDSARPAEKPPEEPENPLTGDMDAPGADVWF